MMRGHCLVHPRKSTRTKPFLVADGGLHYSELPTRNTAGMFINEAQLKELGYMAWRFDRPGDAIM